MVRPRKIKHINFEPDVTYFKPRTVPLSELQEVELAIDELETLRLANIEKLNQASAAKKMRIHQSTFQRILSRAKEKVADALVNGKAIKISGGKYKMIPKKGTGLGGGGRMKGQFTAGPGGKCVCLKCGYSAAHQRGVPCYQQKCPKCGSPLARG